MNRSFGIGAIVLVVATAWLGLSRTQPTEQPAVVAPEPHAGRKEQPAKQTPGSQNTFNEDKYCQGIEDALQKFLLIDPDAIQAPGYCWKGGVAPTRPPKWNKVSGWNKASGVHYMIALLPDPVHTHLAITFDRFTESIEHAAQLGHFTYDSSWLPWNEGDVGAPYHHLQDNLDAERRDEAREDQPGILLFRKVPRFNPDQVGAKDDPYSDGLVIFIVGETPTKGVHKPQFQNALHWIEDLDSGFGNHDLPVLGPFSSGSFSSIEQLLLDAGTWKPGRRPQTTFVSGSASSEVEIERFNEFCRSLSCSFRTFQESDQTEENRFLYLLAKEGYRPSDVAYLSEDETVFGNSELKGEDHKEITGKIEGKKNDKPKKNCGDEAATVGDIPELEPGLILQYPRDIASLRSAYQQQGLFAIERPGGGYLNRQRLLSQDLSEPADRSDDSIKTFSGGQADLSDEGELLQIVLQLKMHRSRYVLLASTNPLDQLFLAHFLRNAYPAGRIVIVGSDELLFREHGQGDLRGVLTLSPYSLSPEVQSWSIPPGDNTHLTQIFTAHTSQGVFYAAYYLLSSFNPPVDTQTSTAHPGFLPGYGQPFWIGAPGQGIPPTWLSVISAGRPWPVAVLDQESRSSLSTAIRAHDPGQMPSRTLLLGRPSEASPALGCPPKTPPCPLNTAQSHEALEFPIHFKLAVIACVVWALLQGLVRLKASLIAKPRCRAYFVLTSAPQHSIVIGLGWACIAGAALTLWWSSRFAEAIVGSGYRDWGFVLRFLSFCPLIPFVEQLFRIRSTAPLRLARLAGACLPGVIVLAYFSTLRHFLPCNFATTIPEQWRGLNLLSGVCPSVPLLLMCVGAYSWCFQALHGLALFNRDQPLLPATLDLVISQEPCRSDCDFYPESWRERVLKILSDDQYRQVLDRWARPMALSAVGVFIVAFALLILLSLILRPGLASLGTIWYGKICGTIALAFIAGMTAEVFQLWRIWGATHDLLILLDRLPLRRTLRAIRDISWDSIWGMSASVLKARYQMIARQLETLRHLDANCHATSFAAAEIRENSEVRERIDRLNDQRRCSFAPWFTHCYSSNPRVIDLTPPSDMQQGIAQLSAVLFRDVLIPAWEHEHKSLTLLAASPASSDDKDLSAEALIKTLPTSDFVQAAEEFVCLNYLAFIQNCMGRIRTLITGITTFFVMTAIAFASYPFDPQPTIGLIFLILFIALALAIVAVYAQAHRDATLSNITNTAPGRLGGDFYLKILQFGFGPALGLISLLVPSISDFIFTWLQPGQMK